MINLRARIHDVVRLQPRLRLDDEPYHLIGVLPGRIEVNSPRRRDVGGKGQPFARRRHCVTDRRGHRQVRRRRFDRRRAGYSWQHRGDGESLLVGILEESRHHTTPSIHDERARVGYPVGATTACFTFVEDAICADQRRFTIRNQRERDAPGVGELLQGFRGVVTDGDQPETLLLDISETALQFHELRFAVRSPVCGAKEHQHGAFRTVD